MKDINGMAICLLAGLIILTLAQVTKADVSPSIRWGNTDAEITWITNTPSNSLVKYGLNESNLSMNVMNATYVTTHKVILTGLYPSTQYFYLVNSRDNMGYCMESAILSFTTSSPTQKPSTGVEAAEEVVGVEHQVRTSATLC